MKLVITIICSLFSVLGYGQQTVSTQLSDSFIKRFSVDSGTYLPDMPLQDIHGKKVTLSDFKGKILYIGIWASSCGGSISKFPYQEHLFKRLKNIHADTLIQLINIHIEDSKRDWLKSIKKYHPMGVNLFCSDTSILAKWNVSAPPTYMLLDSTGQIIAKDISQPDEAGPIDYILYSLIKGVNITEALQIMRQQQNLMAQYRTSSVLSNQYFKTWFNLTMPDLVEFHQWRTVHEKRKSHQR